MNRSACITLGALVLSQACALDRSLAPDAPALSTHVLGGDDGFTLDPRATISRPGGASLTVTGTFACTAGETAFVSAQAFQGGRGNLLSGFGSQPNVLCSGERQTWRVRLFSALGWHGGHANVAASIGTGPSGGCCHDFRQAFGTVTIVAEP